MVLQSGITAVGFKEGMKEMTSMSILEERERDGERESESDGERESEAKRGVAQGMNDWSMI
jgi:hypothetical protein